MLIRGEQEDEIAFSLDRRDGTADSTSTILTEGDQSDHSAETLK